MSILEALFQAILQGLTEFLPVSSSGHLSVFQHLTGISGESGILFSIILHVGTLVAVCIAFWSTIWGMIKEFYFMVRDIVTGKFSFQNMGPERNLVVMVIVSTLPLLGFYFIKDFYTSLASDNDIIVEGVCFWITATLLFLSDRLVKGKKQPQDITWKDALIIGVFQGIAPLPGVSRSGSTICAGLFCGLSRETAVKFSFIMGIPAVIGGAVTELGDIAPGELSADMLLPILIGLVVSAVVGILAIKMVNWLVKSDKFHMFAYYTAVLGLLVIGAGVAELFMGHPIILIKA